MKRTTLTILRRFKHHGFSTDNNSQNIPNIVTSNSDNTENDINQSAHAIKTNVPKINDHIVFINPELNPRQKFVIISQAGKATGKTKHWFKTKKIDIGSTMSVDFSKVKDWEHLEEEVLMNNTAESDNSNEILKGYHRHKTITSQNAPSEAQVKDFFVSYKYYISFSRYSSFCIFNRPMIYEICEY